MRFRILTVAFLLLAPQLAFAGQTIATLDLRTNDLSYDPFSNRVYASVPSSAGANGNSITPINPLLNTVGTSVFIGSEPTNLAISDDGKYLYAVLSGERNPVGARDPWGVGEMKGPHAAHQVGSHGN